MIGRGCTARVVVASGGTRRIGAAICRSFAEQDAVLTAGYRSDAERANTLDAELEPYG
jgi:NAD(P)-dependent dehydrogenase (short-subunit alcohol dehydrogenase family)